MSARCGSGGSPTWRCPAVGPDKALPDQATPVKARASRARLRRLAALPGHTTADGLALHRMRSQSAVMTKRLPHGDQAILDMRKT
jgi:hypothetical protein